MCGSSIDEDEGHSIQILKHGKCEISEMQEFEKGLMDPSYKTKAKLELEMSNNIDSLDDLIDFRHF